MKDKKRIEIYLKMKRLKDYRNMILLMIALISIFQFFKELSVIEGLERIETLWETLKEDKVSL